MALKEKELNFLWDLFYLHLIKRTVDSAYIKVASIYEQSLDLPIKVESLLLEYWSNHDESKLIELALISVRQFFFEIEKHVILVSFLVEKGVLGINEAAHLLVFPGKNFNNLPFVIREVLDISWLLDQDFKEGRMKPDDDDLLATALHQVYFKFK